MRAEGTIHTAEGFAEGFDTSLQIQIQREKSRLMSFERPVSDNRVEMTIDNFLKRRSQLNGCLLLIP